MPATPPVGGTIHLVTADRNLVRLEDHPYDCESHLQGLLAEYPELLAGEQIDRRNPRRWLLIGREVVLPAVDGCEGRWPVDHLFIDQDAIPTIVEVKRAITTRTRRELIGQILDYAASAVSNWHVETVRARFTANCAAVGRDPNTVIRALIGDLGNAGQFWARVQTNLQAGKLRLIIVADAIPADLLRVVDFLNTQMGTVELLAVEVRQFIGQGQTALIPRLVSHPKGGDSAEKVSVPPQDSASNTASTQWHEGSFLNALAARSGADEAVIAQKLLAWAAEQKLLLQWGRGRTDGRVRIALDHAGRAHYLFDLWTHGALSVPFADMRQQCRSLTDPARSTSLLNRLNAIQGIQFEERHLAKNPHFPLILLREPTALRAFVKLTGWIAATIRNDTPPKK